MSDSSDIENTSLELRLFSKIQLVKDNQVNVLKTAEDIARMVEAMMVKERIDELHKVNEAGYVSHGYMDKRIASLKSKLDTPECEHTQKWNTLEHKENHCPNYTFGEHFEDRSMTGKFICGCEDNCYKHKGENHE